VIPGLDDNTIRRGLCAVNWPGRAQWLQTEPQILLDGAHNPEAMQALAQLVPVCFGERKIQLVFGAASDKELGAMSEILRGVHQIDSVILVPLPNERSASVEKLKEFFPGAQTAASWTEAWDRIREGELPVLVTGSLFLVAEVLRSVEQPTVSVDAGELWKVH
jgi:dihydrofolate synthase/folylpolyglutamate synthase